MKQTALMALKMAGHRLVLNGDAAVDIEQDDPVIGHFMVCPPAAALPADLPLDLSLAAPAEKEFRGYEKVFDSWGAWSLWRQGKRRLLRLLPPGAPVPVWQVLTGHAFDAGTLFCSSDLVNRDNGRIAVANPLRYPLDQVLLVHHMALKSGLLIHGAGVRWEGRGCLFAGVSGAGKSTLGRLLAAGGHRVLSDDRVVIRKIGAAHRLFGTPWPGDGGMAVNEGADLAGLFFLHRGQGDRIVPVSPAAAVKRLLPVTSIPWYDPSLFGPALDTIENLVRCVPAFDLFFRPALGVVTVLEAFFKAGG